MYGPTSNSNFDSLFVDDDDDEHHSFCLTNNMLTPNDLPTDALLNPNPNPTDHHNYTYPSFINSPNNNFLHYSPTPTCYDDFSLTHFLAQYQHQDDQVLENHDQQVQPPLPPPPAAEASSKEKKNDLMKETSIGGGERKAAVAPARPQRRRAVGKTDRHSKIYTAQGARDRRMRLSLPIARRFFDLQDMLGFDKASKTIEWLFQKSKSAIKDALNITDLPDDDGVFISEKSEVVVSVGGSGEEIIENDDKVRSTRIGDKAGSKGHDGNSTTGGCAIKDPMVARECRDKARARARERTREKMMIANGQHNPSINASSSSSSSFSSIIMDYTVVHDSHTHQNPRDPNIPQDLQVQSAWDEYSNIGTRYGNNSFY